MICGFESLFCFPWSISESSVESLQFARISQQSHPGKITSYDGYSVSGGVATIEIKGFVLPRSSFSGIVTTYPDLIAAYTSAMRNPSVQQVAVLCDSPGGSVVGLPEASMDIFELRGQKPTAVFVTGQCACAAYVLASAFGPIFASQSCIVGAVGVSMFHFSYENMLSKFGFAITPIHFGKYKVDGNELKNLSSQGHKTLSDLVSDFGELISAEVARNRGVSTEVVRRDYGGGKDFIALQAQKIGMVDGVDSQAEFMQQLKTM